MSYSERMHRRISATVVAASLALTACLLAGCMAEPDSGAAASDTPSPVETQKLDSPTASRTPSGSPSPSASATAKPAKMPTDCREILSDAVLHQLEDVPLNDPAMGEAGVLDDGSLLCVWADPKADTTSLVTKITKMQRGPALDMLNALAVDEGFLCYAPGTGTRCEKTWTNATYPVTDGRTLYWQGDLLVDTKYSNLAPAGYTDSIVKHVFG